jgi:hypothetical protein
VAAASGRHAAAPIEPRIGPARPTRASASALPPSDFDQMTAPMNGTKSGALALIPSRRSAITWPISWTKSSTTKPTAKRQPQMRL